MTVGKVAEQTKAPLLFGTVGVNVAGIRWKDIALIRGGLTDALNSCYYERCAGLREAPDQREEQRTVRSQPMS